MKKETLYLKSYDGITTLHGFLWLPEGNARGVVQLVHGMVEYIDRYHDFAVYLAEHGFAVIGHDHLGHGESVLSQDRLGYFASERGYEILIDDMKQFTMEALNRFPGVPNFILGHSMGSFLLRDYLTRYSHLVKGAVIMGTGYIPKALAKTGLTLSRMVSRIRGPFHRSPLLTSLALGQNNKPFKPNRTEVDWLSRNEENVDRYVADPLCGYLFTASAYTDFFTVLTRLAMQTDFDHIRKDLPVLITSGELDPVGGKAACEKIRDEFMALGLKDVTLKLYPEDRHEILNEVDRDQVFSDLEVWFSSKLTSSF